MQHKENSVPDIAVDPIAGAGEHGRLGFFGQYPEWLSARLKVKPKLQERYRRKSDRMNGIRDNGDDIETVLGTGLLGSKKAAEKIPKEIEEMLYVTRSLLTQVRTS